ncbi:hypothetical protein VAR608DRAFT_4446 [Variovorax sp. HW608]|uniref:hypothetical protein n=1 Tax=Variovorax sp. HW608 TaxID=1034889 RepID=UPI00081FB3D4|nr:hypothetical protein [Variovorax sp. HW608]SCK45522.1 hypothetical protein VAR608DRAFT_4446 [Variovorax sp. HW608]
MQILWSYIALGLLALVAAATIAGGEPAVAELKLAEAATKAAVVGVSAVCLLPEPKAALSSASTAAGID